MKKILFFTFFLSIVLFSQSYSDSKISKVEYSNNQIIPTIKSDLEPIQINAVNDDCEDATDKGILTCSSLISDNSVVGTDVGETDCIGNNVGGVWYNFTVSVSVPTFSITGTTDLRVYIGPDCNSLTELTCGGSGIVNIVTDAAEIYWIMIWDGSFEAKSDIDVPINNLCENAIEIFDGVTVEGYNTCATKELSFCQLWPWEDGHEVYYKYINNNAEKIYLEILINPSGGAGLTGTDISKVSVIGHYGGCDMTFSYATCDILGTSFKIKCINPGETLIIIVGSSEGDEGDFNITVNETIVIVDNDECDGAIDWGLIPSNCQEINFNVNTTDACWDDNNNDGCIFYSGVFQNVWFTFTTDANANFVDINSDISSIFSLFEGDCGSLTYVDGSCSTDGNLSDLEIKPSTTYTFLIGTFLDNIFDVKITISNTPDNNMCVDAIELVNGMDGTNACAGSEFDFCDIDGSGHEVYYSYTNNIGVNVDLDITINGNTNTTGKETEQVDVVVFTDACDNTLYNDSNQYCNIKGTQFTIECIEDGETIILLIGSIDTEEGDFDITFSENTKDALNDECSGAEDIVYSSCLWQTISGDNTNACFEDFSATDCDYDTEPVVWFKFKASPSTVSVEFNNFTTSNGQGFMGLGNETADCDNQTEASPGSECMQAGDGHFGPFNIVAGETYLIAVGSTGGEGAFDFDMKVNESLINDNPCDSDFDPQDLAFGTTFTDNNKCATPDFIKCNVNKEVGKTLFYEYKMVQDADLQIIINGTIATGPFTIATYEGFASCDDESNFILDNCGDNQLTLRCRSENEVIIIMIGTSAILGEFGEYEITVNEISNQRPENDDCSNAELILYADLDMCKWKGPNANKTNIDACSESSDFGTACKYSLEEVVWYRFTAPASTVFGAGLSIQFTEYDGSGTLFATLFEDNQDCEKLSAISDCAIGNGPNGLGNVIAGKTYLIGVGSTGDFGGDFNIEIKITSGPANDDACSDLTNFDLTKEGVLPNIQTNICSGSGIIFDECLTDDQTNAVFYTFDIVAPYFGINIQIIGMGSEPIEGNVVVGISNENKDFCTSFTYSQQGQCNEISNAVYEWNCLEEGTYQVQVSSSDENSGSFEISSRLLLNNLTSPSIEFDSLLCFDEKNTIVKVTGGSFSSFEWREKDKYGKVLNPNNPSLDSMKLDSGSYYIKFIDGNCLKDTLINIKRKPKIIPEITPNLDTLELCFGEDTILVAPSGYMEYKWNNGKTNDTIFSVSNGMYYVTVTDIDGCEAVDSIFIKIYPQMIPNLEDSLGICESDTINLNPGKFENYKWSKDNIHLTLLDGQSSLIVSEGGLYTVIVYNEFSCEAFDTILVNKTNYLTPKINGDEAYCDDSIIVLNSKYSYFKYEWTNSTDEILSVDDTLNYTFDIDKDTEVITLSVESESGCKGKDSIVVYRYFTPLLDISDNVIEICGKPSSNGVMILDFSKYFKVEENFIANSDGDWQDIDNSDAVRNANWTEVKFKNVPAGKTYRYVFTSNISHLPCVDISDTLFVKVDSCLCDTWSIKSIDDVCNDKDSPPIELNNYIIGDNGLIITPTPKGKWTVILGSANVINGTTFITKDADPGTYILRYTLSDQKNYCQKFHKVGLNVQSSVYSGIVQPELHICKGVDVLVILDSLLLNEDKNGKWSEISIIPSSGNAFNANDGLFSTAGQNEGEFKFKYELNAISPCSQSSSIVTVVIDSLPIVDIGLDIDTCFESLPIIINSKFNSDNFKWINKSSGDVLSKSKYVEIYESGIYLLRVTTDKGCIAEDEVAVNIRDEIKAKIKGNSTLLNGVKDTLFVNASGRNSDFPLTYSWYKDGELIDGNNRNYYLISENGEYCVDVEDSLGCIASDCRTVNNEITKDIELPNIFSPNGDGLNDKFFISDGSNVDYIKTFKIFDRWGELVFSDSDFKFEDREDHFWNGTFKGKKAAQGVYIYIIEFVWSDNESDKIAGDITVISP